MTKRVVFAMSYDIETDDDNDAEELATQLFIDDVGHEHESFVKMFGVHVEDIDPDDKREI